MICWNPKLVPTAARFQQKATPPKKHQRPSLSRHPPLPPLPQPAPVPSPFMRLAEHLTAIRAWCKHSLPGRCQPDELRPGIKGIRGSMVLRTAAMHDTTTPPPPTTHPFTHLPHPVIVDIFWKAPRVRCLWCLFGRFGGRSGGIVG